MPSFSSLCAALAPAALALLTGCAALSPALPSAPPSPAATITWRSPAAAEPAPLPPAQLAALEAPASPTLPASRAFAQPIVPRAETRATVLLYHLFGIDSSEQSISPARFEEQLTWLQSQGIEIITAGELTRFLEGSLALPASVAVLTLDDSHKSTYTRAFPLLRKHGIRFTLALNTEAIERHRAEALTWEQVREMVASGLCELASHSHIHGHMDRLTKERNQQEAELSRSILEARTGVRPEVFVFPFGGNNAAVRKVVEDAGYRAAFALGMSPVREGSPRFQIPRYGVMKGTTMRALAERFHEAREQSEHAKALAGGARVATR
jgi:peptidoglycan/xylan/chitin deacetylase (PgdA/CDA1 family)